MRARRRAWLIGSTALVAAAGWFAVAAAQDAADQEVLALVKALQERLPAGSEVTYGALGADPLRRSAVFSDLQVRVGPAATPAGTVRASVLQVGRGADGRAAGPVDLSGSGIVAETPDGASLSLATVEANGTDLAALLATFGGGAAATAAQVGRLATQGITYSGTGGETMTVARGGWEGLAGGRLSGVSLEGISGAGPDGLIEIARASLGALDWNRVDAAALATALTRFPGAGGAGPGGEGEVAPLVEEDDAGDEVVIAAEPLPQDEADEAPPEETTELPEAESAPDETTDLPEVETTPEEAAGGEEPLPPEGEAEGADLAAAAEDEEVGPVFAMVEAFLALAEGELGGLLVEGVSVTPADVAGAGVRLGRLTLAELSRRRFGPLALDSLDVDSPDGRFGLAGLAYDGVIERLPLDEVRAALPGLPRTAEGAARLRELLSDVAGRYEAGLASLAVTRPSDGAGVRLDRLAFSGTGGAERTGTSVSVDAFALDFGKLASGVRDEADLASAGLSRVAGRLRAAWGTDDAAGRGTLDRLELALEGLGDLEVEGAVQTPTAGGDAAASRSEALMALSVVRARLAYTDRSLVSRLLASAGGKDGPTPDVVADALAGLVTNPARTPWLDPGSRAALADFVRRPGRLEIEIAPTEPAPVLDALGIAATEPAELGARLGLRIRATPPS
jgi:hypothetical protein